MKKIIMIISVFIFCFVCCAHITSMIGRIRSVNEMKSKKDTPILVIDAGHGGRDNGTSAKDGTPEKVINLSIALKLRDFARASGISTDMTRSGDYLVYNDNDNRNKSDLYNRLDYINSVDNATLISIHQNFFDNEKEWGMQVWYSPNDNKSKILADNILSITKDNIQKDNSRVNKESDDSYYLLYKATVPSVMVECGFMSNEEENNKLKDSEYQKMLAYSIMLGYCEYITGA